MRASQPNANSRITMADDTGLNPLEANEPIFQKKLFIPFRIQQGKQPVVYPIIFKVMSAKDEEKILIFILSEVDLFFFYRIQITPASIGYLNSQYNLTFKKLNDFVDMLMACLDQIQNQEKEGSLEIVSQSQIEFVLRKMYAGKWFTVIALKGIQQPIQIIKLIVAYRYGSTRQRIQKKEERICQMRELVRLKNPYLLKKFKQL